MAEGGGGEESGAAEPVTPFVLEGPGDAASAHAGGEFTLGEVADEAEIEAAGVEDEVGIRVEGSVAAAPAEESVAAAPAEESVAAAPAEGAGAGGVLSILRMLSRGELEALIEATSELGLFALLEAFDEADLRLAAALVREYSRRTALLVGVNCRDLVTLKVVPGRLEALAPLLPRAVPRVAESGVATGIDAARLAAAGYDVALVGSALMQSGDPLELAAALLAAGRAVPHARV